MDLQINLGMVWFSGHAVVDSLLGDFCNRFFEIDACFVALPLDSKAAMRCRDTF